MKLDWTEAERIWEANLAPWVPATFGEFAFPPGSSSLSQVPLFALSAPLNSRGESEGSLGVCFLHAGDPWVQDRPEKNQKQTKTENSSDKRLSII